MTIVTGAVVFVTAFGRAAAFRAIQSRCAPIPFRDRPRPCIALSGASYARLTGGAGLRCVSCSTGIHNVTLSTAATVFLVARSGAWVCSLLCPPPPAFSGTLGVCSRPSQFCACSGRPQRVGICGRQIATALTTANLEVQLESLPYRRRAERCCFRNRSGRGSVHSRPTGSPTCASRFRGFCSYVCGCCRRPVCWVDEDRIRTPFGRLIAALRRRVFTFTFGAPAVALSCPTSC